MKIIHTSDLHLSSPLTSKLPVSKQIKRRKELFDTFERICIYAKSQEADAVIIAGDLFDTDTVTQRDINSILSVIESCERQRFLYVCGNHEGKVLSTSGTQIPKNLTVFGEGWSYVDIGEVTFAARCDPEGDIFSELMLNEKRKNVVILHGEARDSGRGKDIINLADAKGKSIDYLALGHYHTYRQITVDRRATAVYCGTPEGRGFDEIGELGFVQIDTENGISHRFVPFCKRTVSNIEADITELGTEAQVRCAMEKALENIDRKDMVRITLIGERTPELRYDIDRISGSRKDDFFYLEIVDNTKLHLDPDEYKYDKSLKGEFIRLCLAEEELSPEEKEQIIQCGLSALAGEEFYGMD